MMTFRKDINGLRAIAVIAVVLFHFRVVGFTGGFSGVDIFFVISGYLMTGIIFTKVEQSRFSLSDFYLHRARRIIPALAILCLVLMIVGFFCFLTHDYRVTMRNIKSAIQFTSNIAFNKDSGYFGTPSQENWLLHTWSLSVEWQFYLIYPLFILLLGKVLSAYLTKITIIITAIISLTLSIFYTPIDPSSAFYLLPTRAWEMLAGGIVFLFPLTLNIRINKLMFYLGIGLISLCILLLNSKLLWPGYWAILPVTGAMLIIWSKQNNLITDNPVFQWLGKISYSVYLWHWPIAVLLIISGLISDLQYVFLGLLASLVLGNLSYFFIEKRVKLKYSRPIEFIRYLLIIAFITGLAAILASFMKNDRIRHNNSLFSKEFQEIIHYADNPDPYKYCTQPRKHPEDLNTYNCKIGDGTPSVIVMGDSHARTVFSAVTKANNKGASLLWASEGCPILKDETFSFKHHIACQNFIADSLHSLDTKDFNVPILIVNRLSFAIPQTNPTNALTKEQQKFQESYVNTICYLSKNRPVYILKPIPQADFNVPKKLLIRSFLHQPLDVQSTSLINYHKMNHFILNTMEEAQRQCGAILLDPIPYLCPNNQCASSTEGKPVYFDDNHLTEYGNKLLIPLFQHLFNK